jgi:hypothetical protein
VLSCSSRSACHRTLSLPGIGGQDVGALKDAIELLEVTFDGDCSTFQAPGGNNSTWTWTPLGYGLSTGKPEIVELLLAHKASATQTFSVKSTFGMPGVSTDIFTPLSYCLIYKRNAVLMAMLLEHGASLSTEFKVGSNTFTAETYAETLPARHELLLDAKVLVQKRQRVAK